MKAFNVAAAILVIGAGVVGSYLIIKDSAPTANLEQGIVQKTIDDLKTDFLSENPLSWLNNSTSTSESDPKINSFSAGGKNVQSVNLTQLVAQSMFSSMQKLDQSGKNPFENFDPKSSESRKLIQEAIANIQTPSSFFSQSVEDKDLKILSDNSREAKIEYLEKIKEITQKNFSNTTQKTAEQIIQEISGNCLGGNSSLINQKLISIYQSLVNDYLNTAVPSNWLDFHKKIISHYRSNYLIYQAIENCSNDPIGGYLAAQSLQSLIEDAVKVQNLLIEKYKEVE